VVASHRFAPRRPLTASFPGTIRHLAGRTAEGVGRVAKQASGAARALLKLTGGAPARQEQYRPACDGPACAGPGLLQRDQVHDVGYFGPGTFEQFPILDTD
jgi:hypothetical protein